ncbi:uncharacterized protein LOC130630212 [Hydractinia symbiolongicarpus]|uniref:uncharacterized protein LOC130630212 n=1 Tax=Hydractinia symbiolongicarpus TaxID=13093 RepID=UPI00254D7E8C|nr:uncharacterized protein LOC130630212 [Hydractinia symbiolongicarpus]
MIYLDPAEVLAIDRFKSIRGLFSKIDLDNIKYVLIPYNDGGTHWILTVVDVKSGSIIVLDPMTTDYNPNLKSHSDAVSVAMKILQKKFWKNVTNISIKTEEHVMQKDARSCGVYCCFYASKIMSGGKLTDKCDPMGFRRHIYKTIVGNCIPSARTWKNIQKEHSMCRVSAFIFIFMSTQAINCRNEFELL